MKIYDDGGISSPGRLFGYSIASCIRIISAPLFSAAKLIPIKPAPNKSPPISSYGNIFIHGILFRAYTFQEVRKM